jgi:uncharacterized membrane protein YedE/YeeE
MRTWYVRGVHRLTWVVLLLLVLAVAVFAMAAGFTRLRSRIAPVPEGPGEQGDIPPSSFVIPSCFADLPGEPTAASWLSIPSA